MDLGNISAPMHNESYSEAPNHYHYLAPVQGHPPRFDFRIENPQSYQREDARYQSYQNLVHRDQAHSDIAYQNVRYPIMPSIAIGMDNDHTNRNDSLNCLSPMKATSMSRAHLGAYSYTGSEAMYSGFEGKPCQYSQQTLLSYPSNSGHATNPTMPAMYPYSNQGYGKSIANGSFNKH